MKEEFVPAERMRKFIIMGSTPGDGMEVLATSPITALAHFFSLDEPSRYNEILHSIEQELTLRPFTSPHKIGDYTVKEIT